MKGLFSSCSQPPEDKNKSLAFSSVKLCKVFSFEWLLSDLDKVEMNQTFPKASRLWHGHPLHRPQSLLWGLLSEVYIKGISCPAALRVLAALVSQGT